MARGGFHYGPRANGMGKIEMTIMYNGKTAILKSLLPLLTLVGCGIRTKLSQEELKWINPYNEGDTIIFRSDKGNLDTSIIVKKELFYPPYNPIEVHDKYLPQWGVIYYVNKHLKYHPSGYRMVTIEKKHPNNETSLSIDYQYGGDLFLNITTGSIEKYKQGKVYEFDTYSSKAPPNQPRTIFWHEDYGIIKYVTHGGAVWERINSQR
ncbi:hypothetical protein [Chitinophaga japonensis]|uniref:Uncharacterized protein n=1 Tax=Chitinophaga japonensis TaxID=104662 RepID=A0A562SJ42_CHIJA|nr:hypothetical protein [Chitinophaga japonensis]TWI80856.1 hypothetical protein LX66_5461 [Chitinophaga japonensis]